MRSNVQRALSVLGAICRYSEGDAGDELWLEERLNDPSLPIPSTITWDHLLECCYGLFMAFLGNEDIETKCGALKALGGVFISRPRILLLMEQAGMVAELMAEKSHQDLQIQALKCWKEILMVSRLGASTAL